MVFSLRNKKGQGSSVQYVLTFFLVVGVMAAMSLYVRRAIQGRVLEASKYMARTVHAVYNDANYNIVGNFITQYEPYYADTETERVSRIAETTWSLPSLPKSSGISEVQYNSRVSAQTQSNVMSPRNAYR